MFVETSLQTGDAAHKQVLYLQRLCNRDELSSHFQLPAELEVTYHAASASAVGIIASAIMDLHKRALEHNKVLGAVANEMCERDWSKQIRPRCLTQL